MIRYAISFLLVLCVVAVAPVRAHTDTQTKRYNIGQIAYGWDCNNFTLSHADTEGSRSHEIGFVVRLSGSSKYAMRSLPDKSASWDEWGIFIDRLFKLDPSAKIGHYKSQAHFMELTRDEHEPISTYRPDVKDRTAPWLRGI